MSTAKLENWEELPKGTWLKFICIGPKRQAHSHYGTFVKLKYLRIYRVVISDQRSTAGFDFCMDLQDPNVSCSCYKNSDSHISGHQWIEAEDLKANFIYMGVDDAGH